jgi:uncharacterized protein (TIGR00255 family)
MIVSMTGYGRGEASSGGVKVTVELRSVNGRFLEVSARLPRSLALRENEIKEIVRQKLSRGKINLVLTLERDNGNALPLKIDTSAAKAYYRLLNHLRKTVRLKETVKLEHLLQFSDIFEQESLETPDEREWEVVKSGLQAALENLDQMRRNEGKELENDLRIRITGLEKNILIIEELSKTQVPAERDRLRERVQQLLGQETVDTGRLEMELALLADRLDVTEECVRFHSHNKFFLRALGDGVPSGRKLNFLIQEMNREANTIGSKSSATEIAHLVVGIKEELERIREQLQNIE